MSEKNTTLTCAENAKVQPFLKPCPFCGKPPAFLGDDSHSEAWEITCISCEDRACFDVSVWGDKEAILELWNTRP